MFPDDVARPSDLSRLDAEMPEPDLDDPDNPEWTEEDFARAKGPESLPFEVLTVFPNTLDRLIQELKPPTGWTVLKLDPDVLARFKACGPDWRERMSEVLRAAAERADC